jgi:hypothetical protein
MKWESVLTKSWKPTIRWLKSWGGSCKLTYMCELYFVDWFIYWLFIGVVLLVSKSLVKYKIFWLVIIKGLSLVNVDDNEINNWFFLGCENLYLIHTYYLTQYKRVGQSKWRVISIGEEDFHKIKIWCYSAELSCLVRH